MLEQRTLFVAIPSSIDLAAGHDSGWSNSDNYTNSTRPIITGLGTPGDYIRVFANLVPVAGTYVNGWGEWSVQPSLSDGEYGIAATASSSPSLTDETALSAVMYMEIDTEHPTLKTGGFFASPDHEVRFEFNEDVQVDLARTPALSRDGESFNAGPMALKQNQSHLIRYTPVTRLPDGNFTASLQREHLRDRAGNTPVAGTVTVNGFILAGDADGNRAVDFDDLLILARNYGQAGRTFAEGNFDYSPAGRVDFDDLLILARQYGKAVAAPIAMAIDVGSNEAQTARRRTAAILRI